MIPAAFDYVRAESAADAVAQLAEHGDDAKLLAGGMSLIPLMKLRLATPTVVIDVGRVRDLSYIRDAGDHVAIGALTRHRDVETSELLARECGVVRAVAAQVGDNQVRHRGTIGGSVAHGDPASDLPAALLALDATFVVQGPGGEREIAASAFFKGFLETALAPDELLTRAARAQGRPQRVRLREVQPARAGLRDRRRGRRAYQRRDPRGPHQHGLHAAARDGGGGGARAGRGTGRCRGAGRRRHRARGRSQRDRRVPRAPRAGARRPRARGPLSSQLAAVVLAAGRGVRFGGDTPKPLLELGGRPLVRHAVDAARASGLAPVVVVVGADGVAAALEADVHSGAVRLARNDAPERGISSSLQAALRALEPDAGVHGVVVGLADQPLVGADAYRRLAAAFAGGAGLAVATYAGTRGNPVLIGRAYWNEAMALTGDEGARVLIRRHGAVEVPCDGTGQPTDVDTPQDLIALEKAWRSQTASE